ncbi:MAG: gamma-glutamyltransferase, partial [Oscillospiraceae bacterium]
MNNYKFSVSSAKKEATEIGIKILKNGGNIFDAAVAVGFSLSVCEPHASGIGGGGICVIKLN